MVDCDVVTIEPQQAAAVRCLGARRHGGAVAAAGSNPDRMRVVLDPAGHRLCLFLQRE
jgi:hypothetical protein